MRGSRQIHVFLVVLMIGGFWCGQSKGQDLITPKGMVMDFQERGLKAPSRIKSELAVLEKGISDKGWTFQVGYTTAMDFDIEQITGLKVPERLPQLAKEQNIKAIKMLEAAKLLGKIPVVKAALPTATSFDWRKFNGATGIRDQGRCGSCWDFATHGAFEGSYRITNKEAIDSSEQDTLDCYNYSCGGGFWAFQYLIDKGSAKEADYPYRGVKGNCKAEINRPYKAVAWGFVEHDGSIPSIAKMKQALCEHGPLAVGVNVTRAFLAYTGGVFNENASGDINHGVTLIGWDDAKKAWLIKNSWGPGWGQTCGYGTERGYMWIAYDCNRIGSIAAWVQAKPTR